MNTNPLYSKAEDKYYFIITTSVSFGSKDAYYILSFDPKTGEFDKNEFTTKYDKLELAAPLSNEVINDKIIYKAYTGGSTAIVVLDLKLGQLKALSFDKEVKPFFDLSVLEFNSIPYLFIHLGGSTSKSIYYMSDQAFRINLEESSATFVGNRTNTRGSGRSVGISDPERTRANIGILEAASGIFYSYSTLNKKVAFTSHIFTNETMIEKEVDLETGVGGFDVMSHQLIDKVMYLQIDGPGKLKLEVEIDALTGDLISKKTVSIYKKTGYGMTYYCKDNVDMPLEITEEKGVLTLTKPK